MKKILLTLISLLPISTLSMAATIKLNEITREEKVQLIEELIIESGLSLPTNPESDKELDSAIKTLLKNGVILQNGKIKKGSGGESVGGGFGG